MFFAPHPGQEVASCHAKIYYLLMDISKIYNALVTVENFGSRDSLYAYILLRAHRKMASWLINTN